MKDWQLQVINDRDALKIKLDVLLEKIDKGQPHHINDVDWNLIKEQYDYMYWYHYTLCCRIQLFM